MNRYFVMFPLIILALLAPLGVLADVKWVDDGVALNPTLKQCGYFASEPLDTKVQVQLQNGWELYRPVPVPDAGETYGFANLFSVETPYGTCQASIFLGPQLQQCCERLGFSYVEKLPTISYTRSDEVSSVGTIWLIVIGAAVVGVAVAIALMLKKTAK